MYSVFSGQFFLPFFIVAFIIFDPKHDVKTIHVICSLITESANLF